MSSRVRFQQLAPLIRRVFAWDEEGSTAGARPEMRIADPALGDWARRRIASCAWNDEGAFEGIPVPTVFERTDTGVRISMPLAAGERLYGAADADARGIARRGDHVHLMTEMHPRGAHRGGASCDLCADRVAADAPGEAGDDLGSDRSFYSEVHAPLVISSSGYAVWISNATYGGLVDLGEADPDAWTFTAPGGAADIYVIGPAPIPELVRQFMRLTGAAPAPPTWALGIIQSKFGYWSFDEVDAVVERYAQEQLPLHGVVFDVQWLAEHVNLQWNPDGFADPRRRLAALHASGVRTTVITEPGTRADTENGREGMKIDAWGVDDNGSVIDSRQWYACEQIDGYRPITPTTGLLLNPFRDAVADWWYEQHLHLIDDGVDGWWLDLNEPEGTYGSVNFPDVDWPTPGPMLRGADAHNMFAIAQQRMFARRDRSHTDRRTFMLSRSGHAGSHRYGISPWSGDVGSTWQALRVQPRLMLTAGLCGFSLYSCDIGGFHGEPEPELFARWIQAGTVFPVCRLHGAMSDREPWSRGTDSLAAAAPSLRLRGQLLPSIASWMYHAVASGEPMVRPMLWEDPDDSRFHHCDDQWMFGPLLAAPVLHPGIESRTVHFPAGNDWFDLWSGERHAGGDSTEVSVASDSLPLYVPGGTVLLADPLPLERRGMSWPPAEIEVWAFAGSDGSASSEFVFDDGYSRAHEQGAYSSVRVTVTANGASTDAPKLAVDRLSGAWPLPSLRLARPHPGAI
jgi:alpha-glucosidase